MKTISIAFRIFLILTVLTGIVYPLAVTGIAQLAFPSKANGSLIFRNEKAIGSELLGQHFDSTDYFTSRPSAIAYQTMPSGGSNLGVTSKKLQLQVEARRTDFLALNGLKKNTIIPSEMLFASASGLDPHISPEAALLQVNRIVKARHLTSTQKKQLIQIIEQQTELPAFYCLGKTRINVFLLNLSIDASFPLNDHSYAEDVVK
jgi:potassium-transporting ATPase KdpC subunit